VEKVSRGGVGNGTGLDGFGDDLRVGCIIGDLLEWLRYVFSECDVVDLTNRD